MRTYKRIILGAVVAAGALAAVAAGAHGFQGRHGDYHDRIDHMARELNLTDSQTAQIKAIADADAPQLKALHDQIREHRQALRDKLKAGFDEATAKQEADAIGNLVGQTVFIGSRMKSQMYAVLTPEQKAQLDKRMEQRREHWRDRFEKDD